MKKVSIDRLMLTRMAAATGTSESVRRCQAIVSIAIDVLNRLVKLHAGDSVFGELSCETIVEDDDGSIQLAPASNDVTPASSSKSGIQEKAYFLSPEQSGLIGRRVTAASDLYAVGILIYRYLAGRFPVEADSLSDLLLQQTTRSVRSLRLDGVQVPRALDEIVLRLLKQDPLDRYQLSQAVLDDLVSVHRIMTKPEEQDAFAIGSTDRRNHLAEPSFVGRQLEMIKYRELLGDTAIAQSKPWILTGQAGQGTSRLLDELVKEAMARHRVVMHVSATKSDCKRPFESISVALNGLERACLADQALLSRIRAGLQGVEESLYGVASWLVPGAESKPAEQGPEKFAGQRLSRAIRCLFEVLAQEKIGIILVVDGLDRCDDLSKDHLLNWLRDQCECPKGNIHFIASVSEEFEPELAAVGMEQLHHLGPLDRDQSMALLASMTGEFPTDALEMVAGASHGNPFMAISLVTGLIESDNVVWQHDKWVLRSLSNVALQCPKQSAQFLGNRIDGLSNDAVRYLTSAAVLGNTFQFEEARSLARLNHIEARQAHDASLRRQLIWSDSEQTQIGFVHDAIRQAFLSRMDDRTRRATHLRAARSILQTDPSRCFELANHFDAAEYGREALRFSLEAAKLSRIQYANRTAIRYFQIAQRWIPADDKQLATSVSEQLGDAFLSNGDYDAAQAAFACALRGTDAALEDTRLIARLGDVEFKRGSMKMAADRYAQALVRSGVDLPRSDFSMLTSLLRQATIQFCHTVFGRPIRRKPPNDLLRLRWSLFSQLAHTYWFSRGALWTLAAHLHGLNEAERFEDTPELAKSYSEHAPVCSLLKLFSRANEYSRRSLDIRKNLNDSWGQGQTLSYASVVQLAATRFSQCIEIGTNAIALLEKTGDAWETNMARYQRANALYRSGKYAEAASESQMMQRSGVEIRDSQIAGISLDIWMRSAPYQVPAEIVEAQAVVERTDVQSHAQTHLALALLRLRENRLAEAEAVLVAAIDRCKKAGHLNTYISPCYVWLATVLRTAASQIPREHAVAFDRGLRKARRAAQRAASIAKGFPADRPHALRELGNVCLLANRTRQAARCFRQSIRFAEKLRCPMEAYQTLQILSQFAQQPGASESWFTDSDREQLNSYRIICAKSISSLQDRPAVKETLSLVDRLENLLHHGRRIASSLKDVDIYSACCLAAQQLLRGQVVALAIRSCESAPWKITQRMAMPWEGEEHVETIADYQPFIQSVLEADGTKIFQTEASSRVGHGSLIALPVRVRNTITACLLVSHREITDFFGRDEARLAEFVATLTGAAIENAEGFRDLQVLNRTLEHRVAERTAALEQRAAELNSSNLALLATEEQLRHAIEEANLANQAKTRFLATMSHEIRTPLNGILGMTRLALSCRPNQQLSSYLSTIQSSGDALLRLLNDLLDLSKIESGKMTLESITVDPRQLISEVVGLMAIPAWQKGIELIAYFDPQLPQYLVSDVVRLRQVVLNLVGNAIKFTPQGHVEVRAELAKCESGDNPSWQIRVIDSGIGIPQDKQASIFEAFSQADNSMTRRFGGTGLGLSISGELVRLMEGEIKVTSQEGVGSEFAVVLPLEMATESTSPERAELQLHGISILLIEPHPIVMQTIETYLHHWGAAVVSYPNLEEMNATDRPDLELFQIVVASGPDAIPLIDRAKQIGVPGLVCIGPDQVAPENHHCLNKPIFPSALASQIRSILRLETESDVKDRPDETNSSGALPPAESTSLNILVAEDGEINQIVMVGLLELLGHQATIADNGAKAVELAESSQFDVCLMDLDMPDMDGIEATRNIRLTNKELPIYAMTAHHDQFYSQLCLKAGMNGFLTKPVDPDALTKILEQVAKGLASVAN